MKLIVPHAVARVGYPKCVKDYYALASEALRGLYPAAFPKVGSFSNDVMDKFNGGPKVQKDAVKALARFLLDKDGYGGSVRSIHFRPLQRHELEMADQMFTVSNKKIVKTGLRVRGHTNRDPYSDDSYSPQLVDVQTHTLLNLHGTSTYHMLDNGKWPDYDLCWWVPSESVEKANV